SACMLLCVVETLRLPPNAGDHVSRARPKLSSSDAGR
ncbi:MAG: hypothetical protein QOG57_4132, partial [Pseudonocardiales bacterium]|nr:hypothetical protein [Pseudonocardiales bacterium]